MKEDRIYTTTTFQLKVGLHTELKMMCLLTHTSLGEFVRIAITDKIKQVKEKHGAHTEHD